MGGIKREFVDVRGIIDDLLQMLQSLLQECRIKVDLAIAPALPELLADPVQLQQVILNLVVNAVDAMRDQDEADDRVLSLAVAGDALEGVVFTVRDSGPGISPEIAGKIFDALFSTKSGGLGMGLAISRTIVENHGGRLRLESSPGTGVTFIFNIPVSQ